ncbi:hypothetical protein [Kitasatospora sp. NPDC057015]|uniref:hypothetical protein n=1 Tax=Kitasatospora sp. NPDC057015 TaxID=3346001 RepID=UPI003627FB62
MAVLPPGRANLLVAALRPDGTGVFSDIPAGASIPLALSLDEDPASAAGQIREVFLPSYRQAVWEARTRAVTTALAAIKQTATDWGPDPDDVEDDYVAYYQEADDSRNRVAWPHIETAILHGPPLIAGIRAALRSADSLDPQIRFDLQLLDPVQHALAQLDMVRAGWQQVSARITGSDDNVEAERYLQEELRNELAWPYAALAADGPLAKLAAHVGSLTATATPPQVDRSQAARLRTAPSLTPGPVASSPAVPPGLPSAPGLSR